MSSLAKTAKEAAKKAAKQYGVRDGFISTVESIASNCFDASYDANDFYKMVCKELEEWTFAQETSKGIAEVLTKHMFPY